MIARGPFRIAGSLVALVAIAVLLSGCRKEPEHKAPSGIRLDSRTVTGTGIDPDLAKELEDCPIGARRYLMLDFGKPLSLEDHKQLDEKQVRLLSYLGGTGYSASVPCDTGLDGIFFEFAAEYQRQDKLSRELREHSLPDWAMDQDTGKMKVLAQVFSDVDPADFEDDLAGAGLAGSRHGATTWRLTVTQDELDQLVDLDRVKLVQPGPMPRELLNETSRPMTGTDAVQGASIGNTIATFMLSAHGIRVGICDAGVDQNHNDFDSVVGGVLGASRIYNPLGFQSSHATHVASIAAGSGFNSAGAGQSPFSRRGHAPRAMIGDYPTFGSDLDLFRSAIVDDATDVTNHSYAQSHTVYIAETADLDLIVQGGPFLGGAMIPARPQVWAVGNNGVTADYDNEEGYYAVFASAKNTIGVGSVDTTSGKLSYYSGLGPTFDGRIKPDVVAPGCRDSLIDDEIQAANSLTQGYSGDCGTSMAAPVVTGIIGLMMEAFKLAFDVHPNLYPSTYKALLVNTAEDLVKTVASEDEHLNPDTGSPVLYHAGPDFATGYGLVRADAAVAAMKTSRWRQATIGSTTEQDVYCFASGSGKLQVTLAWDDLPGNAGTPQTEPKLVNDLDLQLVSPEGEAVLPLVLPPLPPPNNPGSGLQDAIAAADIQQAVQGEDRLNNVERATASTGAGIWRAMVTAHHLAMGHSQRYSLASSRAFVNCSTPGDSICAAMPMLCARRDVCSTFQWACEPGPQGPVGPTESRWLMEPGHTLSVDRICQFALDCPRCDGASWKRCSAWKLRVLDVPEDAKVVVFDDDGRVVSVDDRAGETRTLDIQERLPGERQFIAFADRQGNAYPDPLKLRFQVFAQE